MNGILVLAIGLYVILGIYSLIDAILTNDFEFFVGAFILVPAVSIILFAVAVLIELAMRGI